MSKGKGMSVAASFGSALLGAGKFVGQGAGKVIGFAVHNPEKAGKLAKGAAIGVGASYLGWKVFVKDEGIDEVAVGMLGDNTKQAYQKEGLVGALQGKVFGDGAEDKSIVGNVVDAAVGDGTYQKAGETVETAVHKTKEAMDEAGQFVKGQYDRLTGKGEQNHEQNGYLPDGYPMQSPYMYQVGNDSFLSSMSSPFSSMTDLVSSVTGGKMSTLNLVGVLAAAYMIFGSRFGWLGKIAGVMLGGITANSMVKRQQQQQMQMITPYQYQGQGMYPGYPMMPATGDGVPYYAQREQDYQEQQEEGESRKSVSRMRL